MVYWYKKSLVDRSLETWVTSGNTQRPILTFIDGKLVLSVIL